MQRQSSTGQTQHLLVFQGWASGVNLVWSPRSLDHAWGGTGWPEGQTLKPRPSWGLGINQLEPQRVGLHSNFCLSSIAQLSRHALLKCINLCFILKTLAMTALAFEVTDMSQVPPRPKKIQTVAPRGQPNPGSTQTTASLSAKLLFILKSNLPLKRRFFEKTFGPRFWVGWVDVFREQPCLVEQLFVERAGLAAYLLRLQRSWGHTVPCPHAFWSALSPEEQCCYSETFLFKNYVFNEDF